MTPLAAPDLAVTVAAALARDPEGIVGLAVSGGGDSMAMLHLFAGAGQPARLRAVTVDHRLRPGSGEEAEFVAVVCASLGVAHEVLPWDHGEVPGNLEAAARAVRYGLLADWAARQGLSWIGVAHTVEDQAETFLMGLSRAAGLDGLAGMRPEWRVGDATFRRPLLDRSRGELRDWMAARGLTWREDPMNADPRFLRVRARAALAALAPLGIGAAGIAASARHLASAQEALRQALAADLARIGVEVAGALRLDRAGFAALPADSARRLLSAAIRWLNRQEYAPRSGDLARLTEAAAKGRDATLAGCRMRVTTGEIHLCREPRAVGDLAHGLWDRRWIVTGPPEQGGEIRALGPEGLRLLPDWRMTGLPRDVLIVTPAIWSGTRLIAAPLAGKPAGWVARTCDSLAEFILSH